MKTKDILNQCEGFDWDEANLEKNWVKHKVSYVEAESVFFNSPLLLAPDKKHSNGEKRFFVLGRTETDRVLFVAFTIRGKLIRVISARDMTRKEKRFYEKNE